MVLSIQIFNCIKVIKTPGYIICWRSYSFHIQHYIHMLRFCSWLLTTKSEHCKLIGCILKLKLLQQPLDLWGNIQNLWPRCVVLFSKFKSKSRMLVSPPSMCIMGEQKTYCFDTAELDQIFGQWFEHTTYFVSNCIHFFHKFFGWQLTKT